MFANNGSGDDASGLRQIGFLLAVALLGPLLLAAPAQSAEQEAEAELKQLAHALRENPTQQAYERLSEFAGRQAGSELAFEAEFALGSSDFERKRFASARQHFENARRSAVLDDFADYSIALTLAAGGQPVEAARQLVEFAGRHPATTLARDAGRRRIGFLLQAGQARAALRALEAYPETASRPDFLFLEAQALAATGEPREAARAYQKIYYEFPLSDEAGPASEALRSLKGRLVAKFPAPTVAERLGRADKLFDARRYREARETYEAMVRGLAGAEREKAQVRIGASLYHMNRTTAALARLTQIAPQDAAVDAERLLTVAQCYRRLEGGEKLAATLARLGERYPTSSAYEDALFAAANYSLLQKDFHNAIASYQTLAERFPAGRYAARAHWKIAWQTYLDGDHPAAARLMEEHLARFPASLHLANALYWLGRLAAENNDSGRARAIFAKLLDRFPHSYWSSRAEERMRALPADASLAETVPALLAAVAPPAPIARFDAPLPATAAKQLEKAQALDALGLTDLALEALRVASEKTQAPAVLVALARAASAEGRYGLAFETLKRVAPELSSYPLATLPREVWELEFPRPYWNQIATEAERNGLDPLLLAALIRQESAFQANAISSQKAIGLMQVLPKTARKLARQLRLRYGKARLFDVAFNLRLGALYLKNLLEQFSGNLEAALASYNAGEDRVEAWQAERAFRDSEEFVESIPFSETRDYVQIIARNYILYRRLYGGTEAKAQH